MTKLLPAIALTLSLLVIPALSSATEGKVIAYKPACGYLLIDTAKAESANGYLLLKQQGASTYVPVKDDVIDGFLLENFGITYLHKVTADTSRVASNNLLWVYNENSWLTKADATTKYTNKCGPI